MQSALRGTFGLLAALSLLTCPALAQSDSATVSGRITDETGQVLAATRVEIVRTETNTEVVTETNAGGIYVLRNLRPGVHRMTVERSGFQTIVLEELTLAVQDVLGRNFTMKVGPVNDVVTVSAATASLSTSVTTVVDRQFVDDMPLNGRSFQSLLHLTPGLLVAPSGQGMEGQLTVNGQRTNSNYLVVDGVSVNFATNISVGLGQNLGGTLPALTISGGTNGFVSVDAMQEFRTLTSTYAPEFGRMPGAQISIVTRSGTNRFHGTAYDYFRDEALDARNWFNRPPEPKPALHQHNFGGTVGGPLRYDRSFFFLSYEGLRLQQPRVRTGSFYTPETGANVAPVYRPIVEALPVADGPLVDPRCDNVTVPCRVSVTSSFRNPTRFDAYSARFDHEARRGISSFARFAHTPSTERSETFANVEQDRRDTTLATAGVSAAFGNRLLNDLRVGWGRSKGEVSVLMGDVLGAVPPPLSAMFRAGDGPGNYLANVGLPGTSIVAIGRRALNESRQLNIVDTFSASVGRHDLKAGFDYRHLEANSQGPVGHILIVNSFEQLRAGTMGTVATLAAEGITAATHNWSVFVQDGWRVSDAVTMTYGIRWEANTAPVSTTPGKPLRVLQGIFDDGPLRVAPGGTPLWRARYDNLAPRMGMTWSLTSSTVLRGGAGLAYDLGYGGMLGDLIQGFPYNRFRSMATAGQPYDLQSPVFDSPPQPTTPGAGTRGTLVSFDPELTLPRTWQWHAAIERQLGTDHAISLTYVGARGTGLLRPDFVRMPLAQGAPGVAVMASRNAGRSRYDALQTVIRRRLSHGLQALGSYTLSNARDTESDDIGGNFNGAAWNAETASALALLPTPSLAPADFDARHAWSAALSYALPPPGWGGLARAVLSGWSIDAIARGSSARPINVRIQGVSPTLGTYTTQPDLVAGQPIWIAAPAEPAGKVLNPDAFTLPAEGTVGSLARNSIDSPFGINQTDLALRRRFTFAGGVSLEFRTEAFNVFNHPMFGGTASPVGQWGRCTARPCTGQEGPGFGKVASLTLNEGLGGDPLSGGQADIYATGGQRSLQLSLKARF